MKAKIKKTGEIVNVSCMMADYGRSQQEMFDVYIESTFLNARTFTKDELEFISTEDEHWQNIRERAAIAAMQGTIHILGSSDRYAFREVVVEGYSGNEKTYPKEIAEFAVACADALIEELKKK